MKKELNYLSLPDYFNKYLLVNYNQKINNKSNLKLRFQITSVQNIGLIVKAINILEIIYPKKVHVLGLKIKRKKSFMQKKNDYTKICYFDLNLTGLEFVDLYRFLGKKPLKIFSEKSIETLPIVNRKLKNFDFFVNLKLIPIGLNKSFEFIKMYHLD
jgi:branched-subunit amino acid permease